MAFSAKIVGDELVLRFPMNAKPEKSASDRDAGRQPAGSSPAGRV
jgi:hypothetical protein